MGDAKPKPPLRAVYRALLKRWGPQDWWPAESRFEIMVGTILTQNTAWRNVEKAIANMKAEGIMTPAAIRDVPLQKLSRTIKAAGTHRVKARRLKNFSAWLWSSCGGDIGLLSRKELPALRRELLGINGVGPETADCILLYAAEKPVFVVDTYTRRVLERHGWLPPKASYPEVADLFEAAWKRERPDTRTRDYGEYHALLVKLAKEHCRTVADCGECPLKRWLPGNLRNR